MPSSNYKNLRKSFDTPDIGQFWIRRCATTDASTLKTFRKLCYAMSVFSEHFDRIVHYNQLNNSGDNVHDNGVNCHDVSIFLSPPCGDDSISQIPAESKRLPRHRRTPKKAKRRHLLIPSSSGLRGSNPPPQPWQGCALPNELNPRSASGRN